MNSAKVILIVLLVVLIILLILKYYQLEENRKYVYLQDDLACPEVCDGENDVIQGCPNDWTVNVDTTYNTNAIIPAERFGSAFIDSSGRMIVSGEQWDVYRFNTDGTLDSTFGTGGVLDTSVAGFSPSSSPYIDEGDGWFSIKIYDDHIWIVGNPYNLVDFRTKMMVLKYDLNGVLDPTFGTGGYWVDPRNGVASEAYDIDFGPNGEIYVGGHDEFLSPVNVHCIVKLFPDGTIDTSFGASGYARIHTVGFEDPEGELRGVHVQSDGKIVGGGFFTAFNDADDLGFGVVRFNTDGSLDTTFGESNGWTLQPADPLQPFLQAFAYRSTMLNDEFFISGFTESSTVSNLYINTVMKFTADGVLDTTWADNGIQRFQINTGVQTSNIDSSESVTIPCDGGLFVVGRTEGATTYQAFAYKLDNTGQLDTNFGTNGIYILPETSGYDQMVSYNNGNLFEVYAVGYADGDGIINKFTFTNVF